MQIPGKEQTAFYSAQVTHYWLFEEAFEDDTHWASRSSENSVLRSSSMLSQPLSCKRLQQDAWAHLECCLSKKGTLICVCVYVGDSPWVEP